MPNFFRQNCQFLFRAALLIGVLAGLLVSCGEGIRLFPFPFLETSQSINTKWKTDGEISYQKNIHRFESKHENYQVKLQRDKIKPDWTSDFKVLNHLSFSALQSLSKTDYSF